MLVKCNYHVIWFLTVCCVILPFHSILSLLRSQHIIWDVVAFFYLNYVLYRTYSSGRRLVWVENMVACIFYNKPTLQSFLSQFNFPISCPLSSHILVFTLLPLLLLIVVLFHVIAPLFQTLFCGIIEWVIPLHLGCTWLAQ